jgi:hypothetical protein
MKRWMMRSFGISMLLGVGLAGAASAALTTTYDGSGDITDVANWDSGSPSNANPGLISGGGGWLGSVWTDVAVRQTGGTLIAAGTGDLAMRGGAAASGNTTTLEIEDAANTSLAYKNLDISGTLTMWSQNLGGGGHELSLLSGYATIGALNAINSPTLSTINIGSGKLEIATVTTAKVSVNMLAGGTGELIVDDRNGGVLNNMRLNFETGSEASFTIGSNGGVSSGGYWEFFVGQGWASVDGASTTDLSRFAITNNGTSTTITVIPEPATLGLITAFGAGMIWDLPDVSDLTLRAG